MNKIICICITIVTFAFIMPHLAFTVHAFEVKAYQISETQEFFGTPLLHSVIYGKSINMGYKSGKVVISSTPDGAGALTIPDEIVVNTSMPSQSFRQATDCTTHEIPPFDVTHILYNARTLDSTNLTINFTYRNCKTFVKKDGVTVDYAKIGPVYLVHFDDYVETVKPFLELPWDYKKYGLSFSDAALSISSYFDHQYPLLSTNLSEGTLFQDTVVTFDSALPRSLNYSSHDGYDWAAKAKALVGEPVLAAAAGTAIYRNTCGACGNAILIDHGNGYQTRYYHLMEDGLITKIPNTPIPVNAGDAIGKIGYTGNVIPQGAHGAHIHFMVVHDKNGDGNFDDNIPDGLVDPFGWQSTDEDPWSKYNFTYAGSARTGEHSNYLWNKGLPKIQKTVNSVGGIYLIDHAKVVIPKNTVTTDHILIVNPIYKSATNLAGIRGLSVVIKDAFGNILTSFQKLFDITISFTPDDLERFNPETLAIYSSSDDINWFKETTTLDMTSGEAKIQVSHLTDFVLMGEKLDSIAPETQILFDGTLESDSIYNSPVTVSLTSTDEPISDSLGVAYTLYKIDDGEWQKYTNAFIVSASGEHTLYYYSEDTDGNVETVHENHITVSEPIPTPTLTPTPTPNDESNDKKLRKACKLYHTLKTKPLWTKLQNLPVMKKLKKECLEFEKTEE